MSVSPDLLWCMVRNNSSYRLRGLNGKTFSREPNNLKARNSFRYNGLVNKKTVGIEPCKDGKGVVLVLKKHKIRGRPRKAYNRVELKKGARKTLETIKKTLKSNSYRKDLKMAAVRRACAIMKSQKPVVVKKPTRKKKE